MSEAVMLKRRVELLCFSFASSPVAFHVAKIEIDGEDEVVNFKNRCTK
jgi:hypothetical protein